MVIAVTPDGKKTAETALEKKPLLYAQLANSGQNIADEYGISRYPSFVIADKNRIIKLAINGMRPQTIPLIQSTLQALLQP
jgi:peroxiredoxin